MIAPIFLVPASNFAHESKPPATDGSWIFAATLSLRFAAATRGSLRLGAVGSWWVRTLEVLALGEGEVEWCSWLLRWK